MMEKKGKKKKTRTIKRAKRKVCSRNGQKKKYSRKATTLPTSPSAKCERGRLRRNRLFTSNESGSKMDCELMGAVINLWVLQALQEDWNFNKLWTKSSDWCNEFPEAMLFNLPWFTLTRRKSETMKLQIWDETDRVKRHRGGSSLPQLWYCWPDSSWSKRYQHSTCHHN